MHFLPHLVSCGTPPIPTGGNYAMATDGHVTTANYSCLTGYMMTGNNFRFCNIYGDWQPTAPICVECASLSDPTSGDVTISTNGFISTAVYTCVSGYTLIGTNSRTCQSDGSWDQSEPVCECNPPFTPSHGATVTDGRTANYTCFIGYSIQGQSVRTCSTDGTGWSGAEPSCNPCLNLVAPVGSSYTTSTTGSQTFAVFVCDVGYTLTGSNTAYCLGTGAWETLPTCVQCPAPAAPDSGSVTTATVNHSTVATYACATGYNLIGQNQRVCQNDGTYPGSPPTCSCKSPLSPQNGNVTADGSLATYTCLVGYSLHGVITRTCQNDGSGWDGSDPTCNPCRTLFSPVGGNVTLTTNSHLTQATYTCNVGHTLNGQQAITCRSDGTWDFSQPQCTQCTGQLPPSSGNVTLTSNTLVTTATYTCASGYYLTGSVTSTCRSDGTWTKSPPSCKCNSPVSPASGSVSVSESSGAQVAYYQCMLGYSISGLAARTCHIDGTGWEDVDPTCNPCATITTPTELQVTTSTNGTTTTASYACALNYSMSGEPAQTCRSDGTWDFPLPVCVLCPMITQPTGGDVTFSTDNQNTQVTYTCHVGYTLSGQQTITCRSDGTWDSTATQCVVCLAFAMTQSGDVVYSSNTSTTSAAFTCASGYYVSGHVTSVCNPDGSWTNPPPSCKCNTPTIPTSGSVSVAEISGVQVASYQCMLGYTISGLANRNCLDDGSGWEGVDPTCNICNAVTTPQELTFTMTTNGTKTVGQYACALNYTLSGEHLHACQSDGTWNHLQPTCVLCPGKTAPPSGSVQLSTDGLRTSAVFSCVSGYILDGTPSATCQQDGTWDLSDPHCICEVPDDPRNGYVDVLGGGLVANYSCDPGYELDGDYRRHCFLDGTGWNGTQPVCERIDPASPAASTDGTFLDIPSGALIALVVIVVALLIVLAVVAVCCYMRYRKEKYKVSAMFDAARPQPQKQNGSIGFHVDAPEVSNSKQYLINEADRDSLFSVTSLPRPASISNSAVTVAKKPLSSTAPASTIDHTLPHTPIMSVRLPKLDLPPKLPPKTANGQTRTPRRKKVPRKRRRENPKENRETPKDNKEKRSITSDNQSDTSDQKPFTSKPLTSKSVSKESLLTSGASTPIEIVMNRTETPDLLNSEKFGYIKPVICPEVTSPAVSRPSSNKQRPKRLSKSLDLESMF